MKRDIGRINILIIGATGRSGTAIIREAAQQSPAKFNIHAFARTPSKLSEDVSRKCTSVIQGDARSTDSIMKALQISNPDFIIVSIGIPDSLKPSDIREASALALVTALRDTGKLGSVRVAVVSALGAGGSRIRMDFSFGFGFGTGSLIQWVLRHGLRDHDGQEKVLIDSFSPYLTHVNNKAMCDAQDVDCEVTNVPDELLILRPTGLIDSQVRKHGVLILGEGDPSPTFSLHRDDMAEWLIKRIISHDRNENGKPFGGIVTLTGHRN